MAHATQADIIALYGEEALIVAADRDGNLSADEVAVTRELEFATGLIDYKLAGFGTAPNPAPEVVKTWCVDIALYRLSTGAAYTDDKRARYDDALAALNRIADGKDKPAWLVPLAAAADPSPVLYSAAERVFSRSSLANW